MRAAAGKGWTGIVAILALLIAGSTLSLVIYDRASKKPFEEVKKFESEQMLYLTGLARPVSNKLDIALWSDTNSDEVADAPVDAKLIVDPPTLKFSYIVDDREDFESKFSDLLGAIAKATGKKVEYQKFETTLEQLKAIRDGELLIAGLGTGTVPIAVDAAGFVPLAKMADASGAAVDQMQILVPVGSPIKSLDDLKGKSIDDNIITCTDAASNSGFKAALLALKKKDLLPGRDYRVVYSGSHAQSIESIRDGNCKMAPVSSVVLKRELAQGIIKPEQFRSIYKSEDFPTASIGVSARLKPEVTAKIREALLGFKLTGSSMEYFTAEGSAQFVPANFKNDWSLIRLYDEQTGAKHELP
jgi:phosphonate transport system substrate-binding protein